MAVHAQALNFFDNFGFRVALGAVADAVDALDFASHILEQVLGQRLAGELSPTSVGSHDNDGGLMCICWMGDVLWSTSREQDYMIVFRSSGQ